MDRVIGRKIVAVLVGAAAAAAVIFALESLSHRLYPPPSGLDVHDPAALKAHVAALPVQPFLIILFAYALGSFVGGVVSTRIAGRGTRIPALVVGGLFMVFGALNLVSIPHPLWFAILSTLIYLPCAWLGSRLLGTSPKHTR